MHTTEQMLHKVIAGSGFLFALSILPVAHYFLVDRPSQAVSIAPEAGQVAGVSTEADITKPTTCTQRQKDLDDLDLYEKGEKIALQRTHDEKIAPYTEALAQVTSTDTQAVAEKKGLQQLIDQETAPYNEKLAKVESVVASQKEAIASRPCTAE